MITLLLVSTLLAQLPPMSCAPSEKEQREERNEQLTVTCVANERKVRWFASKRGVRAVGVVGAGYSETFLERTGQRLSRQVEFFTPAARDVTETWWWPDGCVLASSEIRRGDVFSGTCARQRSEAPDGGIGQRVVVIPAAIDALLKPTALPEVTRTSPDGGTLFCVADAGPCRAMNGLVMVLAGGDAFVTVSPAAELLVADRAKQTLKSVPGRGRLLGRSEMDERDGGSRDLRTGQRRAVPCEDPLRRLDDGSLLCRSLDGYLRIWPRRQRTCPYANIDTVLISARDNLWPEVLLLEDELDPVCLEVFDGLLDWVR